MLKQSSIDLNEISLQDITELHRWPLWLQGSPTLVDQAAGILYKGSEAFVFFEQILQKKPIMHLPAAVTPQQNESNIV